MALSVFLRGAYSQTGGCYLRQLTQGSFRLNSSVLQATSSGQALRPFCIQGALIPNRSSPLLDSVCAFGTSAVRKNSVKANTDDHSKLWITEKIVSAALAVLIPVSLACPNKILDLTVAVLTVSHIYWGVVIVVKDYIRPIIFGALIPKICHGILIVAMIVTMGGLYHLIFHDIGIANTFRRLWAISATKADKQT